MEKNYPIKLQRSGFTETNLIFINSISNPTEDLIKLKHLDIHRMYSKAGFYDKDINGSYFDLNIDQVIKNDNFNRWLYEHKIAIENCNYLEAMSHIRAYDIYKPYRLELDNFIDSLNHHNQTYKSMYHNYWVKQYKIYPLLENKKILIINSFGSLIERQYSSGNTHKIFYNFPFFDNIDYIDFPYTFFNSGPHKNFFETLEHIFSLVSFKYFDTALVSCGPYGCILSDKIIKILHKEAYTMGSGITTMFGIEPNRNEPFWISKIPEQYIPEGFAKIEKGRYWIGSPKK